MSLQAHFYEAYKQVCHRTQHAYSSLRARCLFKSHIFMLIVPADWHRISKGRDLWRSSTKPCEPSKASDCSIHDHSTFVQPAGTTPAAQNCTMRLQPEHQDQGTKHFSEESQQTQWQHACKRSRTLQAGTWDSIGIEALGCTLPP